MCLPLEYYMTSFFRNIVMKFSYRESWSGQLASIWDAGWDAVLVCHSALAQPFIIYSSKYALRDNRVWLK